MQTLHSDAEDPVVDIRLRLLGDFRVSVGHRVVEDGAWRLRKARTLVKLLGLAPGHRLHRDRAQDLLWPVLGRRPASNNLRQCLHAARRALEPVPAAPRYLVARDEYLALCPKSPLWVDVEAFEEAAATARRAREPSAYRAAIDLYAGDLLPEDRYEQWAEGRRERLRGTYLGLLVELARAYEERGEPEPAIEVLRRAILVEPATEEAHAALIRLYALAGRRARALAQYERLREILGELGAEPDRATHALREDVAAGRSIRPAGRHAPRQTPAGGGRHNLPAPLSSFVGREREILGVQRDLALTRLLTLTGAGGCGKTRLALEVARELAFAYPDGVWLAELAGLPEGELMPGAVAAALGLREWPGRSPVDGLVGALRGKRLLLVLDNCEHLVEAAARLAETLLSSCPELRVLATSREPLNVTGETNRVVPPLAVPDPEGRSAVDDLMAYESVRLFMDRAGRRNPAFVPTPENAAAAAEICRKLDGIPLAIELAASRVGLSPQQISTRLGDALYLLTTGDRTATPRRKTLRGALDWSYDLLSEPERTLFARLSVFAGGFTLDAAERIGSAGPGGTLDRLSGLVDKSLVTAGGAGSDPPRYRMLEPVRQYAREQLARGDEAAEIQRRHAEFFLALAERAEPELRGPQQVRQLEKLTGEHDNLRAAMRSLLEVGDLQSVARFGWHLWLFWWIRGHFAEGRRWMEEALARSDRMRPLDRARALMVAGTMATGQAEHRSAEALTEESASLFRELGDGRGVALALGGLGIAVVGQGRYRDGISLLREATELHLEFGNEWGAAATVVLAAGAQASLGDHEGARRTAEEGLALARRVGDGTTATAALHVLATVAHVSGEQGRAQRLYEEGLALAAELGDEANVAYYLEGLAAFAGSEGRPGRAARLWGAAEALLEAIDATAYTHRTDRSLRLRQMSAARALLDEESWAAAFAEGRAMSPEQAVEYAGSSAEPTSPKTSGRLPGVSADASPVEGVLTRREREVAGLVGRGLTNRDIASELHISQSTVEKHVANTLRKLGLRSRAQIAAWVTERRLLASDPV